MGDKRDEVLRYSRAVERIREQWRQQSQRELDKILEPIADELAKLGPPKDAGPEEKKKAVYLIGQYRKTTEKHLTLVAGKIERDLNKVKRPDIEDDDKHGKMMEQIHEDMEEKGIVLRVPEEIADRYKLNKNVKLTLDVDERSVTVGYEKKF